MTTLAFRGLLLLALVLGASLAAATPPPEKLLPADTLGFLTLPGWDTAVAAFEQSAPGRLWADPAMRSFQEKFQLRFKADVLDPVEKELGLAWTNYTGLFRGQITLAFTPGSAGGPDGGKTGFIFIADTGTNISQLATHLAALRKTWADSNQQVRPVTIRGLEFATLVFTPNELSRLLDKILPGPATPKPETELKKIEWTFGQSDSLLIISDSPKDIERLLVLQSGGGLPALAEQAAYAGDAAQFRGAQAFGWVNLKAILDRMTQAPLGAGTNGTPADTDSIPLARFFDALGLTGLQTLAMNLEESAGGTLVSLRARAPAAARTGFLKGLVLDAKDCSPPPLVPGDAVKFSRLRLDLPTTWTNLEAVAADVSPQAASFLKFVFDWAGKDTDPNFDLRQSLIAQLGDDVIRYEKFPRTSAAPDYDAPPSLVLVGARNAEKAASAIKAIAGLVPPPLARYKEREFLGRTICSFVWPDSSSPDGSAGGALVNYAAGGGYVALSSDAALVEEFLRGHAGGRALRDQAGLGEAAQKVGGLNTGCFSFDNLHESARALFETAKKDSFNAAALMGASALSNRLGIGREGGLLAWFDFSALPPFERVAEHFHFSVSAISVNAEGYTYRLFVPAPPVKK